MFQTQATLATKTFLVCVPHTRSSLRFQGIPHQLEVLQKQSFSSNPMLLSD
jgi:hypothetical protein